MSGHMELQHLMSNSMSEKEHEVSLQGTVFDSNTPRIYTTIPEAQREHTRYNASQVRNVEGSTTGSIPSEELKYGYDDFIGEGSVKGGCASVKGEGGSGGGVVRGGSQRMEAKNMMYEDNKINEQYHHPSLAVGSRPVYSGPVADDYREPTDSYVTCRCKTKDLVVAFFIIVAVLLAVASLALSLLLWFGINDGSDCTCPEEGTYDALAVEIDHLEQKNQELKQKLDLLQNITATQADLTGSVSNIQTAISELNSSLLAHQNSDESTLTLNNIHVFDSCVTSSLASCTLQLSPERDLSCPTSRVQIEEPGTFLQRAYCRIYDAVGENNTLSTALVIEEQTMSCRCSRVIPEDDLGQVDQIGCEIVVTRCALRQSINATLTVW